MYKLQSNGAFHMSSRIGLGYDNMQLKPDYHGNRHFSLINNLDMKELNSCKSFDYVKKPYSKTPSCTSTAYSLSNYQVIREEKPPVLPPEVEMTGKSEPDQNGAQPQSRKRKRNRKRRRRRNRNRKNKASINDNSNDILITQFCAITIEPPQDTIDGCCSPKRTTILQPNTATIPLIRTRRTRLPSDCESEDSFIVFGDENVAASIYPQSRTRLQSDCISEDSFIVFDGGDQSDCDDFVFDSSSDDYDRLLPRKKVRFASEENLCEVHPMIQWSYAYQKARKGPWEQFALDTVRFRNRVVNLQPILGPVLEPSHRNRIYKERFEGSGLD